MDNTYRIARLKVELRVAKLSLQQREDEIRSLKGLLDLQGEIVEEQRQRIEALESGI